MPWIMPSYNRPQQCQQALNAIAEHGCSTPGVVVVNGGKIEEYQQLTLPPNWSMEILTKNIGFVAALNYIFAKDNSADFFGFIADDEFVQSKDWDTTLIKAAGSDGIANGNDRWHSNIRIQGGVCIGGDLVRAVGYMAIPTCWHSCGFDDMWEFFDRRFKLRTFCIDVFVEHKHHLNGKAEYDDTYAARDSREAQDGWRYSTWLKEDMHKVVKRIKNLIGDRR